MKDCFNCIHRNGVEKCPYLAKCISGEEDHFEKKAPQKLRIDVIKSADVETMAELLASFCSPELKKKIPNLSKYIEDWLSGPATDNNLECWFLK